MSTILANFMLSWMWSGEVQFCNARKI